MEIDLVTAHFAAHVPLLAFVLLAHLIGGSRQPRRNRSLDRDDSEVKLPGPE